MSFTCCYTCYVFILSLAFWVEDLGTIKMFTKSDSFLNKYFAHSIIVIVIPHARYPKLYVSFHLFQDILLFTSISYSHLINIGKPVYIFYLDTLLGP